MFSNSEYTRDLLGRDFATIWHPNHQIQNHESISLVALARAKGLWLEDTDGNKYLDAISSCGVNLFGHSHAGISSAIRKQLDVLESVPLSGFTHELIVELTEQILSLAPEGLSRCFYTETGSTAIEAAIKMSFHYWQNNAKPSKRKFVTLSNSYHGETIGALSLSNLDQYTSAYQSLLFDVITVPSPDCYYREQGEDEKDYVTRMFVPMDEVLAEQHNEIAAVVVEPLVQARGYMRMYHGQYLKLLSKACDHHGIHLIADETEVGFGRTGSMFACDCAGVSPDIMCLSKGLTNGCFPMSVTVTTEEIYQAIDEGFREARPFTHSSSNAGNPLACAAAVATMNLMQDDRVMENNQGLSALTWRCGEHMLDHPNVSDVRQAGMVFAIEMAKDKATKQPFLAHEQKGLRACQHAVANHVLFQSAGDVLYFMPPYVIEPELLKMGVEVMCESVDAALS